MSTPPQLTTTGNKATNKHYMHTQIIKVSLYSTDLPTFLSAGGQFYKLFKIQYLCLKYLDFKLGIVSFYRFE